MKEGAVKKVVNSEKYVLLHTKTANILRGFI